MNPTSSRTIAFAVAALTLALSAAPALADRDGGHHRGGGHGRGFYGPGLFLGGVALGLGAASLYRHDRGGYYGGGYYGGTYYSGGYYGPPVVYGPPVYSGYVVATTPPAVEPPARAAPDPVVYPSRGQSPAQTEADRQACNRWATTQPSAMADASVFHRATTACLEGRGYTVR